MPHVSVSFYPGREDSVKKEIARKVKSFFEEEMDFPNNSVSVAIVEIEPDKFVETIKEKYDSKDILIGSEYIDIQNDD